MSAGEQLGLKQDAPATQGPVVLCRRSGLGTVPGGADISWIVGFAVASLLYLAGARRSAGSGRVCRRPLVRLRRVICGGGMS